MMLCVCCWIQIYTTGKYVMHAGGLQVFAGGMYVGTDGTTSNSGLEVTSGGAQFNGISQVCLSVCLLSGDGAVCCGVLTMPVCGVLDADHGQFVHHKSARPHRRA